MSNKPTVRDEIYTAALVLSGFILLMGLTLVVISVTVPDLNSMLTSGIIEAMIGAAGIALVIWFGGKPFLPPAADGR
ncbi:MULTISPECIES: hypothetical protein [Actinomycetes]|uniref:Uncharacterized protein n=1 Tax=Microbacterium profundi TaxID=450380 RepID=A0ABV3LLF2_9MICO